MTQRSFTVDLPTPPSVWRLYRGTGKRRHRSPEYRKWIGDAGWTLIEGRNRQCGRACLDGKVEVDIHACRNEGRKRDLDNILKALLDLLTSTRTIADDSQVVAIDAHWVDDGPACRMTVRAVGPGGCRS